MDIKKSWEKALKNTEIPRARVQELSSYDDTHAPYIFLSESTINPKETVVRSGEVLIKKPSIVLPPNIPQFEGFEFEKDDKLDQDDIINFLLVRGVSIPSLKYNNLTHSLDIFEGSLSDAVKHYLDRLQRIEDVNTGLVIGPDDCWQFSVLIFVCGQIAKNSKSDIRRLMRDFKEKGS